MMIKNVLILICLLFQCLIYSSEIFKDSEEFKKLTFPKTVVLALQSGARLKLQQSEYEHMETLVDMLQGPAEVASEDEEPEISLREDMVSTEAILLLKSLMTQTVFDRHYPEEEEHQKSVVSDTLRDLINTQKLIDDEVGKSYFLSSLFKAFHYLDVRLIGNKNKVDEETQNIIRDELIQELLTLDEPKLTEVVGVIKEHTPLNFLLAEKLSTLGYVPTHTLTGHSCVVDCLVDMGNNKIVSASRDRTLRVWDILSGECLTILKGHSDWIHCVIKIKPDLCASGSYDKTIRTWNINTGNCMKVLKAHFGAVVSLVAFKGGRIASGSSDETIRVWNSSSGNSVKLLTGHKDVVSCLIDLNDTLFCSGSGDKTIRIWQKNTGKCLKILRGEFDSIYCLTRLNNEMFISGYSDGALCIWNNSTNERRKLSSEDWGNFNRLPIFSMVRLDDDSFVVSFGRSLRVIDLKADESRLLVEYNGYIPFTTRCLISSKKSSVFTVCNGTKIDLWHNALILNKLRNKFKDN